MTDDALDIARIRRFAEAAELGIASLPREVPGRRATADGLARRVRRLRARTLRRLSFAVVGEFDAGKSLLLSVLVGIPDLLRVSSTPTTANVTAVRLRPAPDGAPARLRRVSVSFLSADAVSAMLNELVGGVHELVKANGLPYAVDWLADFHPLQEGWGRFNHLGIDLWPDPALNPELRLRLAEITRIRDALAVGDALLAATDPGPQWVIEHEALRGAVEIGGLRATPAAFPMDHPGYHVEPDGVLDAATLARVQPLVHRVTYEVDVPPSEWSLGGLLAEPGIEILDMPGLNSAGGARDEYLALRELEEVTGLLVVLDARKPEAGSVLKLPTFLERARSSRAELLNSQLVVGNRFDVLPTSPMDGSEWSKDFASLQRMAGVITKNRPELVAYTSALAGVVAAGLPMPPGVVALPEAAVLQNLRHWGEVAGARPHTPEAAALRDYAAGGGIVGLRRRLASHVVRHGLTIHLTELRAEEQAIRDELSAILAAALRAPVTAHGDTRLAELLLTWRNDLTEAVRMLRPRIDQLHEVDRMVLPDGRGVLDELRRAVVETVYGWEQWPALAATVHDRMISPQPQPPAVAVKPTGDVDDDVYGPGAQVGAIAAGDRRVPSTAADDVYGPGAEVSFALPADRKVPLTADDFVKPYADAIRVADAALEDALLEAIREWAAEAKRALGAARRVPQDAGLLDLLINATPGDDRRRAVRRIRLGDLRALGFVETTTSGALAHVPKLRALDGFPLTEGRAFPWHPDLIGDRPDAELHQSMLPRMRHTLAASIVASAQMRLVLVLHELAARLHRIVGIIDAEIPNRAELQALGGRGAVDAGSPAWEATLRELLRDHGPTPTPIANGDVDA